jgi:dihydroorotase-like cyclic amidohydrolase
LYKNKHSAYVGYTFKGKVESTYVRGKPVFEQGKIVAQPGYGRALSRQYAYTY